MLEQYTKTTKTPSWEKTKTTLSLQNIEVRTQARWPPSPLHVQWKLDLADTSLAENLGLKDTFHKKWETVFLVHKSAKIAEISI